MNSEQSKAVAYLSEPGSNSNRDENNFKKFRQEELFHYRNQVSETIIAKMDFTRFGITRMFVSENIPAKKSQKIEFHIILANDENRDLLETWLEGWNLCLSDVYNIVSGISTGNIIKFNIYYESEVSESVRLQEILMNSRLLKAEKN